MLGYCWIQKSKCPYADNYGTSRKTTCHFLSIYINLLQMPMEGHISFSVHHLSLLNLQKDTNFPSSSTHPKKTHKKKKLAALSFHARSNSFPAESHPLVSEIDEQVCRLRQPQTASTSSSISQKLNGIQDLYENVDKLLQLPTTQQALAHDQKCFNEVLDGSLRLLDLCNAAKDALSQMKESAAELQSAIRRRQGGLEGETKRYLKSRSIVKKAILKALKGIDSKKSASSNNVETISMLKEAESAAVEVLECLLLFISQTSSKSSSWSLVSKLMTNQKPVCRENEFADVDASLKMNKPSEEVQVQMKSLELCIQDLDGGVECLFRHMMKTRAFILNAHNM